MYVNKKDSFFVSPKYLVEILKYYMEIQIRVYQLDFLVNFFYKTYQNICLFVGLFRNISCT